ncbi:MAG: sensor histidine kinase/response regulator [Phenylobacterium sp.]|uniref:HWE histidine kinase domain-containing protein n=1 Tax=Phenylobacterium sp. TaxID=1871053 RepID=UPI002619789B|nr:HWE histidine kinase domain-containing protein [Phenylobacterium sp.]MDB5428280.1 sensor histidine kinase/response regulator [Phenylobacterium sp.]MDB5433988.1 sensor histidine kinase/response regulator [Phenylobacterium sp.]MDB5498614.1 sensor histidine kinase/response regulator [Phenylobacterium sp.]
MTRGDPGRSEEHRRLELALQVAGLGEFEWDMARGALTVSERMAAITGFPPGPMPASDTRALEPFIHPDDLEAFRTRKKQQRPAGGQYEFEFRVIRPDDGRTVWVRVAGVLARDAEGRPRSVTGIVEDITPRKLEEDQRQTLMAELDHRVKNVLATVQSLAIQTARRTTSLDGFLQNFGGRLKAMGSANELLTAARWRGAAIDHLAAAELGALAPGQTAWEGPELFLTPRAANALALGLHELAANAVKFGALSVDTGRVNLRWTQCRDGGFELTWTESGGPTVTPPIRRGFGSTLLEQVTGRELNGETHIDYRPAGVRATLRAGAAAVAPRPETVPEAPAARIAETVATSSGPTNLRGARVLIVEDAVLLAMELEIGLSHAGARVIGPAYELEEAMGLLDQPIDAAVLDANLNGHSVTPVAQALAARQVPFVFATGYGEAGGAPGGFDAPVIRKPYDVTQVAAAVAELLKVNTPHP